MLYNHCIVNELKFSPSINPLSTYEYWINFTTDKKWYNVYIWHGIKLKHDKIMTEVHIFESSQNTELLYFVSCLLLFREVMEN